MSRFRRQLLLAPTPGPAPGLGWPVRRLGPALHLAAHPELLQTWARAEDREIGFAGLVVDVEAPERGAREIAQGLVDECATFEALEEATARLAGRYALLARFGDTWRFYPDATGSRPLFRADGPGGVWLATSPGLLAEVLGLEPDLEYRQAFAASPFHWWPGSATAWQGMTHPPPNHWTSLADGKSQRFWPRAPIAPAPEAEVAEDCMRWLGASIRAMAARHPLRIGLTGGHDSRLLLAASRPLWDRIHFFTLDDARFDPRDLEVPRELAGHYGLSWSAEPVSPPGPERLAEYDAHVSGMIAGLCREFGPYYLRFPAETLFLEGAALPVGRRWFHPDGEPPERVDARSVAEAARFGERARAAEAPIAEWLAGVPPYARGFELDLFYWEQRLGNWNAYDYCGQDLTRQVASPANCRRILERLLAAPAASRDRRQSLQRRMFGLACGDGPEAAFDGRA